MVIIQISLWVVFVALLVLTIIKYKSKFKFWWQGLVFFLFFFFCLGYTQYLSDSSERKKRYQLYNSVDQRLKDVGKEVQQGKFPVVIQPIETVKNSFFCIRYDGDSIILDDDLNSWVHYSDNYDSIKYMVSSSNWYEQTGDYQWAKYHTEFVFVEIVDIKDKVIVDTFTIRGPDAPPTVQVKRGKITQLRGNVERHKIWERICYKKE